MADNYKQYKKAKKKKNLAQKGQVSGGALAGIGAGMLGLSSYTKHKESALAEKLVAQGKAASKEAAREILEKKTKNPGLMKKAGVTGAILTAGGATLAGLSTVKAQRAKRKLKELTEDDSKEK